MMEDVDVLRTGRFAVVEGASQSSHYPGLVRLTDATLDLPWIRLEYYDETTLPELFARGRTDLCGIAITSGAFALPQVREILKLESEWLRGLLRSGAGIVLTATSLPGSEWAIPFLDDDSAGSFQEAELLQIGKGEKLSVPILGDAIVKLEETVLTSVRFNPSGSGWKETVVVPGTEDAEAVPVAWRTEAYSGRVIVSVVSFERLHDSRLARFAVIRAARGRTGLLILEGPNDLAGAPRWYTHDDRLAGLVVSDPRSVSDEDVELFGHLRYVNDPAGDTLAHHPGLSPESLLRRLENGGSVEFASPGPGGRQVFTQLAGKPDYVHVLLSASARLAPYLPTLHTFQTFDVLAYAVLCRTAGQVIRDANYLPDDLSLVSAQRVVEATIKERVQRGSVDRNRVPTRTLLAAAMVSGLSTPEVEDMRKWLDSQDPSDPSTQEELARIEAVENMRPGDPDVPHDCVEFSPLDDAIEHYLMLSNLDTAHTDSRKRIAAMSPALQAMLTASETGNLELMCYQAAEFALASSHTPWRSGHETIHVKSTDGSAARTHEVVHALSQATDSLSIVTATARIAVGILALIYLASSVVLVSTPFWAAPFISWDRGAQVTVALAIIALLGTLGTALLNLEQVSSVAPRWARSLRVFTSRS